MANPAPDFLDIYQPMLDRVLHDDEPEPRGRRPARPPRQRSAKRRSTAAAAAVVAAAAVGSVAVHGVDEFDADHHIGAPAPLLQCQAPDTITSWWVPDSSPEAKEGGPWAVHWDDWTELNGCGEKLTIGTETKP
jgi:hypothetical protein